MKKGNGFLLRIKEWKEEINRRMREWEVEMNRMRQWKNEVNRMREREEK